MKSFKLRKRLLSLASAKVSRGTFIVFAMLLSVYTASARQTYNFNSDWTIDKTGKAVTLPHAWNEDDAFRLSTYDMKTAVVWYRKKFRLPAQTAGKRVFIEFEGARQLADVWLNGHHVGKSENGVMAFGFDLTPYLKKGANLIEVKTDNHWDYKEASTGSTFQWMSKPFYVNYGGLTKNVWLHVTDQIYQTLPLFSNLGTTGTYIYGYDYDVPTGTATLHAESEVRNETDKDAVMGYNVTVIDNDGQQVAQFKGQRVTVPAHGSATLQAEKRVAGCTSGAGAMAIYIPLKPPLPMPMACLTMR